MAFDLSRIQSTIGYTFKNPDLLEQAFIRRSYSEEKGGPNNEVLEFIGDKALDLAVIRIRRDHFGQIDNNDQKDSVLKSKKYFITNAGEGRFSEVKAYLVQKKALSQARDKLGFQSQLIRGNGDIKRRIQNEDSVKEDLLEAILGAVTLDSSYDRNQIKEIVLKRIDFSEYFNNPDRDVRNCVGELQEYLQKRGLALPEYEYAKEKDFYRCILKIKDLGIQVEGRGRSEAKARIDAAEHCRPYLLNQISLGCQYTAEVGEPKKERALAQINELVQKKWIGKPKYEFSQSYDKDGNPIWTCTRSREGMGKIFSSTGSEKKKVQNDCAYQRLCLLRNRQKENKENLD